MSSQTELSLLTSQMGASLKKDGAEQLQICAVFFQEKRVNPSRKAQQTLDFSEWFWSEMGACR